MYIYIYIYIYRRFFGFTTQGNKPWLTGEANRRSIYTAQARHALPRLPHQEGEEPGEKCAATNYKRRPPRSARTRRLSCVRSPSDMRRTSFLSKKPDFVSQASPRPSGYDPSKRRDSAAQAEELRARISGISPNATPSGTPGRRGSLGGAPVTAKLESLTQELTALKEERGTLRDLANHLKAQLKEKDRELETLKVVTHHSLTPWSSTRRAVRSFHVALYAVRALSYYMAGTIEDVEA